MNQKSREQAARERCKGYYDKLANPQLKPLYPSIKKKLAETETDFLAGCDFMVEQASEGFDSFVESMEIETMSEPDAALKIWQAAKLGSAREIEELRDSLSKAHLHMGETGNYYADKINELKRDLEWTLKFINPLITHSGSEYGKKEAIRTKHFGNEKEGV